MLELVIVPGCYLFVDDEVFGFITFDGPMDTTHIPDRLKFLTTGHVDMFPNPTEMAWVGDRQLHFITRVTDGLPFTTYLEYIGGDPLFKTARGKIVKPFGPIAIGICPAKMSQARRDMLLTLFPDSVALQNWSP